MVFSVQGCQRKVYPFWGIHNKHCRIEGKFQNCSMWDFFGGLRVVALRVQASGA